MIGLASTNYDPVMESDDSSRNSKASIEQEEVFEKRLKRYEKLDVAASLDHLVAVGSKWEQAAHRVTSWDLKTVVSEKHQEDERLYSKDYLKLAGWHDSKNRKRKWEEEHGDGIHPLAFSDARLSMKERRQDDVDEKNLSIETTSCDVSTEHVPRALLSHCWQRAVHAVATTVPLSAVKESRYDVAKQPLDFSSEKAIMKCAALRLSFPKEDEQQVCPSCEVVFDEREQLHRHYYGAPNQRGCCWRLIDRKHHELLDEALQADVKATMGQLFELLGKQVYQRGSPNKALTWKEVMGILSSVVAQSKRGVGENPVVETLQPDGEQPISLNPLVIEAVYRRLVDRYADIPR